MTHFHTIRSLPNTRTLFNPFHCPAITPATPTIFPLNPISHINQTPNHICDPCDRSFNNYSTLMQHLNQSLSHNYCDSCDRDFTTYTGLIQHYANSPRHDYCQLCEEHFDDSDDLDCHMDDRHWWCRECHTTFTGDAELQAHFRRSHANRYCKICEKLFGSASNLRSVRVGFRCDTPVS